ncbi:hypothetical protein LINPERHAP1_LOCUS14266, partial [Linum perenne]
EVLLFYSLSLVILLLFPCSIYVSSFLIRYQHETLHSRRFTKYSRRFTKLVSLLQSKNEYQFHSQQHQ